jgi:undecaprenyl-diphosphatase
LPAASLSAGLQDRKRGSSAAVQGIVSLDRAVLAWIVAHRQAKLDRAAGVLSASGSLGLLWIALGVTMTRGRPARGKAVRRVAGSVWPAYFGAGLLARRVGRPRPAARLHARTLRRAPKNPSMPSEHAAAAFAGAISVSAVAPGNEERLLLLAALVSLSRPWLGVHYLSDTVCGAALGALIARLVTAEEVQGA